MTDKEKVLKVWPDTIVYGNKILWKWLWYRESDPDKISGKFDTEEAAWQNAAESLPAQPEQDGNDDDGKCGASDDGGHNYCVEDKGHTCRHKAPTPNGYHFWPVAPVEAKEKEVGESYHWCRFCGKVTNHNPKSGFCLNCDGLDEFAEPKPTPSTPAHHLVERIAAYIESESECLMKIVPEETKHDYGVRLLKVMAEEIREKFQPQPDSSSISSEQTFEDWKNSEEGRCMIHKALPEDAARCAWAAAKGSK